ncbi:MAG: dihydrolipoyl dehydrogenase [Candidatus Sericytochromatia bacterium]|nr:dihydrolipoyl dehydrogenase [Candidatus Sericytochromatia bacterium]
MEHKQYDAVVIGAGPGGYACGIRLGQLGLKTLVIERGSVGGVCLNVGCIPSKAIIHAAKTLEKTKHAGAIGVVVESVHLDFQQVQAWKNGIVRKLTGGVSSLLKANKAEVLRGEARLAGSGVVEVVTEAGPVRVEAPHIVIATGSRPIEIPGFSFGGPICSSTEALSLPEVPARLVVIGGGYIGLELGQAYAKMGASVTVVEAGDQLLPGQDPELVGVVAKKLAALGVTVVTQAKAVGWVPAGQGARVEVEVQGRREVFEADKVLVTVGRRPNSEGLGLEALGVALDRGFITVDAQLRTNVPGLYAIGDVAGQPMLAHKASMEAEVVAEVIAGKAAAWDVTAIPAVIFTDPEIATVGLTPAQVAERGLAVRVGKFPFAASGRAMTTGDTDGFVKVLVERDTERLLGIGIVGPQASDLIAEATLALEMGAHVDDVGLTVHAHPTLPEAFMEAVKHAVGAAVHTVNQTPAARP